jgi:hypothetical protein
MGHLYAGGASRHYCFARCMIHQGKLNWMILRGTNNKRLPDRSRLITT